MNIRNLCHHVRSSAAWMNPARWPRSSLLVPLALLMMVLGDPAMAQGNSPNAVRKARILVAPKPGLPDHVLDRLLARSNARAVDRIRGINVRVVEVPENAEAAVAAALRNRIEIDYAEPDRLLALSEDPNDPLYANGWHLQTMDLPGAWPQSLADGIRIAILDTGVDAAHPDLASKLLPGYNATLETTDTSDIHGHGTAVAGSAAAISNNGIGVTSIAWNALIIPVRVSNASDGVAYTSDIARGLTWAADNGARVANISYAVGGSATVSSAAQYFKSLGGLVVNSAGNSGSDSGAPPNDTMITVSATGSSDVRTSWSSFGNVVDLAAPGSGIYTTKRGGGYGTSSGTSFSSPLTAGVVALVMAANPSLNPTEVETVLKATAVDLGDPGWDPYYGAGRVDAGAAVQTAAASGPGDSEAPTVDIVSPAGGDEVSDVVEVNASATDDVGVTHTELLVNGQIVATDMEAPYQFMWDSTSVANGAANLMVYAYDASGNRGNSSPVSVMVANQSTDTGTPTVVITSPSEGATVSGNVTLSAYATDDQGVAEVRLLVDGKLRCAGSPSVSCGWNTRKESPGQHVVSAIAKDTAGNESSASVSVTVGSGGSKGGGNGGGKGKKN